MSLIEVFPGVADHYAVDPAWTTEVLEGALVKLNTSGSNVYVGLATATAVVGVAGDSYSTDTSGTPYSESVVIGVSGTVLSPTARLRSTQNRATDMFDETVATGKITVYHGFGTYKTDQYVTGDTYTAGASLYSNASGKFTTTDAGSAVVVGLVMAPPTSEPSGVPGTTTPDGSTSLGSYLRFKLLI